MAHLGLACPVALVVPESADPDHSRADPIGTALAAFGLAAVVYAIIEAPERGWSATLPVVCFSAGLVALAAFVV